MSRRLGVLIVEDSADDTALLVRELRRGGYDPVFRQVETREAMETALQETAWDLVVSDYSMPDFSGAAALDLVRQTRSDLPFILVSGAIGEETAVAMMKAGANDYVMKTSLARLVPAVERELREADLHRERISAEYALRQSEERFAKAFSASPAAISISQLADGRYLDANLSFLSLLGFRRDEVIGRTSIELGIWANSHDRARMIELLRKQESVKDFETRFRTKSGDINDVLISVEVIEIGDTPCLLAMTRDVTERNRAEQALRASEERYRLLFHRNLAGVILASTDGRILDCNAAFAHILGYASSEELFGHTAWELYFEREERERLIALLKQKRSLPSFEVRLRRKDGGAVWVLANVTLVPMEGHTPEFVQGTITDITERKQAEESLRQLSAQILQLQDEERRRLAHELHEMTGQNLAALAMNLGLLQKSASSDDSEAGELLSQSLVLTERCLADVRTFSYLLHPPLLDEAGLESAVQWYTAGFEQRSGIRTHVEMSPEFGRLPEEVETTVFRIIQECLTNIHGHSGSSVAFVRLLRDSDQIRLEVRDEGRGIMPEGVEQIDRSAQVGVGTAGIRERVRQLGGRLEFVAADPGLAVRVTLPLRE